MKSVLIQRDIPSKFIKGELYILKNKDLVVLSTNTGDALYGVVIHPTNNSDPIGHYSVTWTSENFILFTGIIELQGGVD